MMYEYLCAKGHRSVYSDADELRACRCGAEMTHCHAVDVDNDNVDPDDHSKMPAPVEVIGFDHALNSQPLFKPGAHWQKLEP